MLQKSYTEPMTMNNISRNGGLKMIKERRELSSVGCQNDSDIISNKYELESETETETETETIDLEMRGSPLRFLSVSGLKSSFQSFFNSSSSIQ